MTDKILPPPPPHLPFLQLSLGPHPSGHLLKPARLVEVERPPAADGGSQRDARVEEGCLADVLRGPLLQLLTELGPPLRPDVRLEWRDNGGMNITT